MLTYKAAIAAAVAAAAVVCLYLQPRWQLHQPTAVAYLQDTALNTPAWDHLTNTTACKVTDLSRATLIVTQSLDPDREAADIGVAYPAWQHVYGAMRGVNAVGNKANMALLFRQHLPAPVVASLTPPTYILTEMEDLRRLDEVKAGQGLFYFKSYVHAQHMVRITDNPAAVLVEQDTPYIVSQEILGQPLTVHDTKITLRTYLLLIARQGSLSIHVAKDGPIYYADDPYEEGNPSPDVVVANKYPLAPAFPPFISGLLDTLGEDAWEVLWENILRVLGTSMHALQDFLERQNADIISSDSSGDTSHTSSSSSSSANPSHSSSSSSGVPSSSSRTRSIILGVDLLPLQNLTIKLLEINAAPHLGILYECKDPARKQASVQFAADLLCGGLHLAGALHCPSSGRRLWMPLTTGLLLKEDPAAAAAAAGVDVPGSSESSRSSARGPPAAEAAAAAAAEAAAVGGPGSKSSSSASGRSASEGGGNGGSSSSSSAEGVHGQDSLWQQQRQQGTVRAAQAADGGMVPAVEDN